MSHYADAQGARVDWRGSVRQRRVRELDGAGRGWTTRALQLLSHRVLRQVIPPSLPGCLAGVLRVSRRFVDDVPVC